MGGSSQSIQSKKEGPLITTTEVDTLPMGQLVNPPGEPSLVNPQKKPQVTKSPLPGMIVLQEGLSRQNAIKLNFGGPK